MAKIKKELQTDILRVILERPKTTGEVAMALGYVQLINGKEYGDYHSVKPALNKLESDKFIHKIKSIKKSRGAKASTYEIVNNRENIKNILKDFPSLISNLQKNENVISILIEEHGWIIEIGNYPKIEKLDEISKKILYNDFIIQSQEASWLSLITESFKGKCNIISPLKNDLKEKLMTSPSFFNLFVNNSSDSLKSRFYRIYSLSFHGELLDQISEGELRHPIIISSFLDILFKACVYQDIMNGEECDEAEKYIKKMNEFKAKYISLPSTDGSQGSYDFFIDFKSGEKLVVQVKSTI